MSASAELQKFIYDVLVADAGVGAIVGDRIYDHPPEDATFPFLSFGASDYVITDDECIVGREETLQVDCWTRDQGRKRPCRELVDAVKAALHEADGVFTTNALVEIRVTAARVFDDPDGLTAHGVVTVTAMVEEAA